MKILAFITLLLMTCLCCDVGAVGADTVNGTSELSANINHALLNVNQYTRVGITIKSMKYGDTLFSHNDKTFFIPASTLKVLTAEAALLYLGANYKFPTRLVTDASSTHNGIVDGNVYLINSGDPTLTYNDLASLVTTLKEQNIHTIRGNIYIDNSAYDTQTTGPGWLWNDKRFCYAAPISASIINHNCVSFRVTPTRGDKIRAKNITDPRTYYAIIENSVVARPHANNNVRLNDNNGATIDISGCLAKGRASTVINDVLLYDKCLLKDLFMRNGIQVQGTITGGNAKPQCRELAHHDSKPLRELISDMLKMSDNIIAGSLFKKLGQTYTNRPGTWESGGTAVAQILSQQAALDVWHLSLIDGSGLSRYNQVTPAQMLKILDFAFHNDATGHDFIAALPVAGIDGTLKRRMKNIAWRVRAKTGTLQGVISLAGYVMSADKEPLAFVIMINGRNGSIWKYRELEDRIMLYLTHYTRQVY